MFISLVMCYFYPSWSGNRFCEEIHSHDDIRKPGFYLKDSEDVFLPRVGLFHSFIATG